MRCRADRACFAAVAVALAPAPVAAEAAAEVDAVAGGSVAVETRVFTRPPASPRQDRAGFSPSLVIEPELRLEWNDGLDYLTLIPFVRLDADDDERTHADVREASWTHLGEDYDLVLGISKVFWGVAESRHLVDVINQTDLVEDIDQEDKLGQPMASLTVLRDWGALTGFLLPGFRLRTFPGDDARLRGPLPVAAGEGRFESDLGQGHVDLAFRYAGTFGDIDLGLAHFFGTGREPRLLPEARGGRIELVPHYDLIHQTGLDLQATRGAWLWKGEAIARAGQGEPFLATVAGFEHTRFGVLDTAVDLGLLAEVHLDGRDDAAPPTVFDHDLFLGSRLAFNDVQGSEILAGVVVDWETGAMAWNLEAERRIGERYRIEVTLRAFANVPDEDLLAGIRKDDYLEVRLARFF
ncbi:MAG TPA: hypothetical protein VFZ01_16310 [Geminicoccaceae bacterium]